MEGRKSNEPFFRDIPDERLERLIVEPMLCPVKARTQVINELSDVNDEQLKKTRGVVVECMLTFQGISL